MPPEDVQFAGPDGSFTLSRQAAKKTAKTVRLVEDRLALAGLGRTRRRNNRGQSSDAPLLGKTTAAHSKGATQSVQIYSGDTKGSESAVDGFTVAAYNRFADLDDDAWVIVRFVDSGWELMAADPCA